MKLYYCIIVLVLPLIMMLSGMAWKNGGPAKINKALGYRTTRSMKSLETWHFAHRYVGKLWRRGGAVLTAAALVCCALFWTASEGTLANASTALVFGELAVFLVTIPLTERQLKQSFDGQGRPLEKEK